MRGEPGLLDIIFLVVFLLLLRSFLLYQDISDPYTPRQLKCRPFKGEKITKCKDLREAVIYAANAFFTTGILSSLGSQQNPPRIIIGIVNGSYRVLVPEKIMGIPVEVEVTGKPT